MTVHAPPKSLISPKRNAMARYAKAAHKKAARILGYALTLGTFDAWQAASDNFAKSLGEIELASLGYAVLNAMTYDNAMETAESALGGSAGPPNVPLFNHMDEAKFWAEMASEGELKAYILAAFNRLSPREQSAFFAHVQRRAA